MVLCHCLPVLLGLSFRCANTTEDMTMTTLTIEDALLQAQDIWFEPGCEDMRLDAISWLKATTAKVPQMIMSIAESAGIHARQAIDIARLIDDADGFRMARSKAFTSQPLAALDIWNKANSLYQKNLHNPDSSGAAHSKLVDGQYSKNQYKPGLISKFQGDKFMAFTAYYLAFGGMRAVHDVQQYMGWSADKIRDIILVAISSSNKMMKNLGKRGLRWIVTNASAGMGLFQMLFAVIQKRSNVLTMAATKKAAKANTSRKTNTATAAADDDEDEVDDGECEATADRATDGRVRVPSHDDPDDDGNNDGDESNSPPHSTADPNDDDGDGNKIPVTDDVTADDGPFDDPTAIDPDDPDNPDPDNDGPSLKMGRELAYEMLRQARKNATRNHRFRNLMDAVDEKILVNALQKDLRPTDLAVAERMAEFISFCWQWAERAGIFLEPSHRKKNSLDMPESRIIKQIVHAVQKGYWQVADNKPANNKRIWIDVIHEDRNGRPRVAALTRPISPQLRAKPCDDTKGRMIIVNPDHAALREFFFQHNSDRNKWPREEKTRYYVVYNGEYETITAKKYIHPRGTALTSALSMDDLEDTEQFANNAGADDAVFDFPDDDIATIQMVASETGADEDVIRRAMDGDDRAREILAHTCRALPDDRKAMIEATFSQGKHEAEIDDSTEAHPSCLDQKTRRDLAGMLKLDLGTLEKAFQDDSDSVRALKRAIKNMPEHLRNQAIRKIHLAARH